MCAIAQCHEAKLLRARLRAGSKFDLLSEVIFKDLAVPAVTVRLTLDKWFVLHVAVAMFY